MVNDYWTGKNEWFDRFWSAKITLDFAKFWLDLYGAPELYLEKHEYFIRMSFAFQGWFGYEHGAQLLAAMGVALDDV